MSSKITQEPTPTTPIVPSSPRKSKINLLILLVIVLLIGAFGGYYLGVTKSQSLSQPQSSPLTRPLATPDETEDWKSYSNSAYNYLINYPPNWFLNTDFIEPNSRIEISSFDPQTSTINENDNGNLVVDVWDNLGTITLDEWLLKNNFTKVNEAAKINDYSAVKISNRFASKLHGTQTNYVLTDSHNNVFVISLQYGKDSEYVLEPFFTKILLTFKFYTPTPTPIVPNPTTPIYNYSDWKIEILDQINDNSEFSGPQKFDLIVKIPKDWNVVKSPSHFEINDPKKYTELSIDYFSGDLNVNFTWPSDAKFIFLHDWLTSGCAAYIVRYLNTSNGSYIYDDSCIGGLDSESFNPQVDKVSNWLAVKEIRGDYESFFKPLKASLRYNGPESELNNYLKINDQIIASLVLEKK